MLSQSCGRKNVLWELLDFVRSLPPVEQERLLDELLLLILVLLESHHRGPSDSASSQSEGSPGPDLGMN